ncbi:hypothetical protein [Pseudomonas abietaniphila]|uniref:Uncharacterized protein n=1 Tax=Pseudomonas abietaniphila TaxID=89065 RepID=A0A1G8QVT2_9PSED|nr:hypothetical protein [Pseudomonas abietaniphila]SDJ08787.1 hypothetical protein SAMN05216605_12179 [Pseudomonas abietaniphila]
MLTLKRNDSSNSSLHSVEASPVEWFPHVTVDLSCWHGGQKLKDLEQFEWHGDVVMGPALEQARRACDQFRVDNSSSLEVWAFRSDWEVAKTRSSEDQHWAHVDNECNLVSKVLLSHHPVWSSRHGALSAPIQWPQFDAKFLKFMSVKSNLESDTAWTDYLTAAIDSPPDRLAHRGVALVDGRIRDLSVTYRGVNDRSPDCHLIMVTGTIRIAMSPYVEALDDLELESAVNQSLSVKIELDQRRIELDTVDKTLRMAAWELQKSKNSI